MELLEKLNLDLVIIALVLCGGFFQSYYLFNIKLSAAVKTLVVSFVFTMLYAVALWIAGSFDKSMLPKFILSYAVATSMYELLIKKYFSKGNNEVE